MFIIFVYGFTSSGETNARPLDFCKNYLTNLSADFHPRWEAESLKEKSSQLKNQTRILKSAIANSILLFLEFPFLHLPDIRPIEWASSHNFERWRKIHTAYRMTRFAYITSLSILGISYLASHPGLINSSVDFIQTSIRLRLITSKELYDYERKTYDPQKVVEEQLQMWIDAFDSRPTEDQITEQRKFFEGQERAGLLRVEKILP